MAGKGYIIGTFSSGVPPVETATNQSIVVIVAIDHIASITFVASSAFVCEYLDVTHVYIDYCVSLIFVWLRNHTTLYECHRSLAVVVAYTTTSSDLYRDMFVLKH